MWDYITLGTSPVEEPCVAVSQNEPYMEAMRLEARRFMTLLREKFPIPESLYGSIRYRIKCFPHDFGDYLDVCLEYDASNEEAINYMLMVESNIPATWDDEYRKEEVEELYEA